MASELPQPISIYKGLDLNKVIEQMQTDIDELEKPIRVLNDGAVRLIDHMGTDESISQAARCSYAKGTRQVSEDRTLIRFLMRHEHYSPFSMATVKFHLRLPVFIHNQLIRHMGLHWNVMSGRYSVMPDEKWEPSADAKLRGQGTGNKQVGNGELEDGGTEGALTIISHNLNTQKTYEELLAMGVCREQARTILPMGQYTECFVTGNLGEWMQVLRQRLDPHAQAEVRVYAEAIQQILNSLFPICMEAFRDYQLNRVVLSAAEYEVLVQLLAGKSLRRGPYSAAELAAAYPQMTVGIEENLEGMRLQKEQEENEIYLPAILTNKREREEFLKKINYV